MMKYAIAATAAVLTCAPEASSQSILQKTDWQGTKLETYLPDLEPAVPWLNLDTRTKLPKSDPGLGRFAAGLGALVLQPHESNIRISSHHLSDRRAP